MTPAEFFEISGKNRNDPMAQAYIANAMARVEQRFSDSSHKPCPSRSRDGLPCMERKDHDLTLQDHRYIHGNGDITRWGPLAAFS